MKKRLEDKLELFQNFKKISDFLDMFLNTKHWLATRDIHTRPYRRSSLAGDGTARKASPVQVRGNDLVPLRFLYCTRVPNTLGK